MTSQCAEVPFSNFKDKTHSRVWFYDTAVIEVLDALLVKVGDSGC